MSSKTGNSLSFIPFTSVVNPSFWNKFTELKLDVYKNSDEKVAISGYFSCKNTIPLKILFEVDSTSFNRDYSCNLGYIPYAGSFHNENTIENFKLKDKNALLLSDGKILLENIRNGKVLADPSMLNAFVLLSFADLKKYQYYYWFAFLSPNDMEISVLNIFKILDVYSSQQLDQIYEEYTKICFKERAFFAIKKDDVKISQLKEIFKSNTKDITGTFRFFFSDGSALAENPSWTLKNYILFIYETWPDSRGKLIDFVGLRLSKGSAKIEISSSVIFNIIMPEKIDKDSWIGWEKTDQGKLGPRMVNLRSTIDPKCLIESSADLNLKLMKWRMLKDIDLSKLTKTKCLLLGAGTLGCTVASSLLGWGIRFITFVDNSTVSYSNPSRQILYTFKDCVKNTPKALAAAENLKKILPHIKSKGVQMTIPMPGHVVGENMLEQTKDFVDKLKDLIKEHDVIFLLTDSRESRWLPAVLGLFYKKIVINAALGFDTYLVMRHGALKKDKFENTPQISIEAPSTSNGFATIAGYNLGCYFCTDVTAPGNSQTNRTLDQQCTVTRPGVAMIAGALAAELMISILQHDDRNNAPAFYKTSNKMNLNSEFNDECMLGIVPHSIRGFLSSFTQVLPATQKFNKCICCSDRVLDEYKNHEFQFILKALNNSKYLEDLSGITEMKNQTDDTQIEEWDLSDDE